MIQDGDKRYLEIPGDPDKVFELPPLVISKNLGAVVPRSLLLNAIDDDGLVVIPDTVSVGNDPLQVFYGARQDMATNLGDKYVDMVSNWYLGDCILGWIGQCKTTFSSIAALKFLVDPDLWPHAKDKNIGELLVDKGISGEAELKEAVGMRLAFRKLPPVEYFSDQFMLYLEPSVANTAYDTWASTSTCQKLLPPERFSVQVISI